MSGLNIDTRKKKKKKKKKKGKGRDFFTSVPSSHSMNDSLNIRRLRVWLGKWRSSLRYRRLRASATQANDTPYPIALISCAFIIQFNFGNLETNCDWIYKYLLSQKINCTGVTPNVIALLSFQCSNNSYWAITLKFTVEMWSITKILGHWKQQLFSKSFFFILFPLS